MDKNGMDKEYGFDIDALTIYTKKVPEKKADTVVYPEKLHPEIKAFLWKSGIELLYSHQAEMFDRAGNGENLVITTSTASGKTLSFLLPVIQAILTNPLTRAIFIYPTKALASDQYRALLPWLDALKGKVSAGVYDGDTAPAERSRIRKQANIILTNPEMLNTAFLPNHSKYGFDLIFHNLRFIVIDELHVYRGAFGSHVANLFRRINRVCRFYGSDPLFLCSSATIANPLELAGKICGKVFGQIKKDGSPSPQKEYRIIEPPEIRGKNENVYGRRSAASVVSELLVQLLEEDHHFIAFGKTRRGVEVILKETRDKLDAASFLSQVSSGQIAGYRGGYTPAERKTIEKKMASGEISGLVSTNALELGIDIGSLDTTVLTGYPGNRASFWQQTGRAGRGQEGCVNYLVLENLPIDQYIAIDPSWLFDRESEHAIVDSGNLLIELAHIRSAAAEIPLTMDDLALFPELGEVLPVLLQAKEISAMGGKFLWCGPAFPEGDYSMRNMDQSAYRLMVWDAETGENREVTQMDESQAYHELFPGAVYMHDGSLYEVTKLDRKLRVAEAVPFLGNYYTVPAGNADTRIINALREDNFGRCAVHFGDINVDELITMFKKLQFHNHQNLGYVQLGAPLQKDYDTESCWIELPGNVVQVYRQNLQRTEYGDQILNNHFEGLAYAIKNASAMVTMADSNDIDVIVSNNAVIPDSCETETTSLFIYDRYTGGLGYSEKVFELIPEIIEHAAIMVGNCACKDGCPACVGDYTLDKNLVLWGLNNLKQESAPPKMKRQHYRTEKPSVKKAYSFERLPEDWKKFCETARKNGDVGSAFLQTAEPVFTEGHKLILTVKSSFAAEWLKNADNQKSLLHIIRYHASCPADMKIEIRTENEQGESKKIQEKLRKRYEDILRNTDKKTE